MLDYNDMRTINGAQSLIIGVMILIIGITLLHRGYAERAQWVRMVPGRVVIGSFLALFALITIEAASAKLLFRTLGPGGVGAYINNWYINLALFITILIGFFTLWRLFRNTLGSRSLGDRVAVAEERSASAQELQAVELGRQADATEALVEQGATK